MENVRDLTQMLVAQARISAMFKFLKTVNPEDGEMVKEIMSGVLDSIREFDLDYLDVPKYKRLVEIRMQLGSGDYSILPLKED